MAVREKTSPTPRHHNEEPSGTRITGIPVEKNSSRCVLALNQKTSGESQMKRSNEKVEQFLPVLWQVKPQRSRALLSSNAPVRIPSFLWHVRFKPARRKSAERRELFSRHNFIHKHQIITRKYRGDSFSVLVLTLEFIWIENLS